jgi:CheY-like chemotaxis protein
MRYVLDRIKKCPYPEEAAQRLSRRTHGADPILSQPRGVGGALSASIIVVDDEPDVAELFRQRFRREARQGTYVMHFAASGEEALELLSGEIEPGVIVILSDINMPGMDGLQLLGEIKQRRPDLPVMMVTAYGDDERRDRARELGAFEFISKPVDFDFLKKAAPPAANRAGLTKSAGARLDSRLPSWSAPVSL